MRFTLQYRGPLKANGRPSDKQPIRRVFHKQLAHLWQVPPLNKLRATMLDPQQSLRPSVVAQLGGFNFAPLVSSKYQMGAKIKVLFLRPGPPGNLLTQGGDIDNRMKTLFDALRMPNKVTELPARDVPSAHENPFFCVLEDDSLITELAVSTDMLLTQTAKDEAQLLIQVETTLLEPSFYNLPLA
jgi:hypothetical protein